MPMSEHYWSLPAQKTTNIAAGINIKPTHHHLSGNMPMALIGMVKRPVMKEVVANAGAFSIPLNFSERKNTMNIINCISNFYPLVIYTPIIF